MTGRETEVELSQRPLWEYVPVAEYKLPESTMAHAIRGGIMGLLQRFRSVPEQAGDPLRARETLQALKESALDRITPEPDWRSAAMALKAELTPWINDEQKGKPGVYVVAPPHGNNDKILMELADDLGWKVLSPPEKGEVLGWDSGWIDRLTDQEGPWVLPQLERCFLRHARGLNLVRLFYEKLQSGLLGRGIIGCDSWAWAYFSQVIYGIPPDALVMQAFDHHRLTQWFQGVGGFADQSGCLFRQSDDGVYVLPRSSDLGNPSDPGAKVSPFLQRLAAHSLGIPGVAWSIWRSALKTLPEETVLREAEKEGNADLKSTIWVLPWDQLSQPVLPVPMRPDDPLILHNLLLHNGLTLDALSETMPLSSRSLEQRLVALKGMGLVEQEEGRWRVSACGYPVVRKALHSEGYLIDD